MNPTNSGPAPADVESHRDRARKHEPQENVTTGKPVLQAALSYAEKGRPVFPCDPASKRPLTGNGFMDATTDPGQIKKWWQRWPGAMIGAPTGNGVFVLDVDLPHGPETLAALEQKHGPLPRTRESRTASGGRHLFFKGEAKNSAGKLGPGLDVRGSGGYVILPHSRRADGEAYTWTTEAAPASVEWLQDAIREATSRPAPAPKQSEGRPGDDFNQRGDIRPILERHGWKFFRSAGVFERWTRPGKETGASATIYDDGSLYVFTGNAPPFESDRRYSPFAVYALLEHAGQYEAAAAALRRDGYGEVSQLSQDSQPPDTKNKPLVAVDVADFLQHQFPPRQNLLAPWLPSQGIAMVYAYRGIGKTYFALGVAYACASGGAFLGYQAPAPVGVLYLDGEMPGAVMQERISATIASDNRDSVEMAPLKIVTPDLQPEGMPRIDTEAGQAAIEAILAPEIKLIVVDNISTLTAAKENEAEGWTPVQAWVLRQRAAGRSVLLIHHAGKGGAQRGTSKREDVLDTVIRLNRPVDYQPHQGAVFEIHFEKARGLFGEDVTPVEASLTTDEHGKMTWATRSVEAGTFDRVVALLKEGLSQKEIAIELGVNKSSVSRHARKAESCGLVPRKPTNRKGNLYELRPE